ncbi:hypothetical protein [Micrococcus luteus]|uniref:hypothetical protein n=1 Tax=Micrococcus luteus TaxID=1270 RepID=UPI00254A24AC|nr:hypothetical protein [Micrococcus luteus]MDK8178443.1 hypothetical protein [Micrococcus luteus]
MNRPRYTPDTITRFMALARQGTGPHAAPAAPHPASNLRTGAHRLNGTHPTPRDLPPLTNADGTPADTLPTTTPEDNT